MGWCGGTEIFDGVMRAALPYLPAERVEEFVEKIAEVLWEGDWDCEMESDYFHLLEPVLNRRFPEALL